MNSSANGWKKWIITLGGAGWLPAPGTWGSLVTCAIVYLLLSTGSLPAWAWELGLMVLFCALSVWLGPWGVAYFGRKDPGGFVLDEAAGICLTMLFLPLSNRWGLPGMLACGFVAFRIFDITKPPPARQLERLPQGWGILMDDLAAAVYANLTCQILLRWVLRR